MVELNLIPWRAEKLKYDKKRQRIAVMLGVFVAVSMWAALHTILQVQIDRMRDQLRVLQLELTRISAQQNKKTSHVSDSFSAAELSQFLSMLTTAKESGVCYQQIVFENHVLLLAGQSWSTTNLLEMLKKIQVSEKFSHFQVSKIEKSDKYR